MLKPSDNPPIIPPWVSSIEELEGQWWLAQTKARNEKAFAWDLNHRHIGYFLPMFRKSYVSGSRKRNVMMPVFPSYVFFCGSAEDRLTAFATKRLYQAIPVPDEPQFVKEVSFIHQALASGIELDPSTQIVGGKACRVKSGPLKGLEGIVVQQGIKATMLLKVTVVSGGAQLEIDEELLEPVK